MGRTVLAVAPITPPRGGDGPPISSPGARCAPAPVRRHGNAPLEARPRHCCDRGDGTAAAPPPPPGGRAFATSVRRSKAVRRSQGRRSSAGTSDKWRFRSVNQGVCRSYLLKIEQQPLRSLGVARKRATPAQVNVLLRRHSRSEALFHCECVTALRERRVTSFVTLQRARYGVDL